MTIGGAIRARRQSRGLTLKDVSALAEMSIPHLSDIERDAVNPPLETLRRVACALHVSVRDLIPEDETNVEVDSNTLIPTAGNQSLSGLAQRIAAFCTDPFKMVCSASESYATRILEAVYLAGYQKGVQSECERRRNKEAETK